MTNTKPMKNNTTTFILVVAALSQLAFSFSPIDSEKGIFNDALTEEAIRQKTAPLLSEVAYENYTTVRLFVKEYVGDGKYGSQIILGRTPLYYPLIESEIARRNMPQEIKFLPVIESNLNPRARSHRGAVGLWQFMPATARAMGLVINEQVDERRDVYKSTMAALDYLQELHDIYGDWTIAIAAYNCGTPRMNKAIQAAGSKDFERVQYFLPGETRNYIPKLIAAGYMVTYYHLHDLNPKYPNYELVNTKVYKTLKGWTFDELESVTGVPKDHIRKLNPAFCRDEIPESPTGYDLILPVLREELELALRP